MGGGVSPGVAEARDAVKYHKTRGQLFATKNLSGKNVNSNKAEH